MSDKYLFRIWCETEQAYVYTSTWATEEPTECPNDAEHTINTDSIAIVQTGKEEGDPYCYINFVESDRKPYRKITKDSWETIAKFMYVGWDMHPISSFSAVVGRSGTTGTARIRLRDMVNNNILAEMSWTTGDAQTVMDQELENVPTESTILQIQVKLDSNSDSKSYVYSTGLGYCSCG